MKINNKQIENKLANEVKNITPDVLGRVLSHIDKQPTLVKENFLDKLGKFFLIKGRMVTAYAMALIIIMVGAFALFIPNRIATVATIAIDVNPSLELEIGSNNKVLSVKTNNEDAVIILGTMNLENIDLDIAVNALIGSMVSNGYLDEFKNSILLSVKGNNVQIENSLKTQLSQSVNNALQNTTITGSIITQTMLKNDIVTNIMQSLNISNAKASIIEKLIELDPRMTAEGLAALSINDLNLLMNAKNLSLDEVEITGTASNLAYIVKENAVAIALTHAGLMLGEIIESDVDLEQENGLMVYEINFKTLTNVYEYVIKAVDGVVIEYSIKTVEEDDETDDIPLTAITQTQALEVALEHSGILQVNIEEYDVEYSFDDPLHIYEINFKTATENYDYEMNALTGEIISFDIEIQEQEDEEDEED